MHLPQIRSGRIPLNPRQVSHGSTGVCIAVNTVSRDQQDGLAGWLAESMGTIARNSDDAPLHNIGHGDQYLTAGREAEAANDNAQTGGFSVAVDCVDNDGKGFRLKNLCWPADIRSGGGFEPPTSGGPFLVLPVTTERSWKPPISESMAGKSWFSRS
jgi:hypothetical protein